MSQQNIMATGSTNVLSEERKREISTVIIPAMVATIEEKTESFDPSKTLKDFLKAHLSYPIGRLSELVSSMAGQHVFTGEVEIIYNHFGISYS